MTKQRLTSSRTRSRTGFPRAIHRVVELPHVQRPSPLEQADDIARALAFVQAKAPSWGGDPTKVLLLGHLAGAHLVSLLTADPRIVTNQGGTPWLGTIVLDSAAFDLVEIMQGKHYGFCDRAFGKDRTFWTEMSP